MQTQTSNTTAWSPLVLKGQLVPTAAHVRIEIGSSSHTCQCIGLAEDGFVVQSERRLPARVLLRCWLTLPGGDEMELCAFAATDGELARQEIKPIGMSREMANRWKALRRETGGRPEPEPRARGTGPRPSQRTGVYVTLPQPRGAWLRRLVGRGR